MRPVITSVRASTGPRNGTCCAVKPALTRKRSAARCDAYVWGTAAQQPVQGATLIDAASLVWGTSGEGANLAWGRARDVENIVWGTNCGGADCANVVWGTSLDADHTVWGAATGSETTVWGTSLDPDTDIVVWQTNALADFDDSDWGATTRRRSALAALARAEVAR